MSQCTRVFNIREWEMLADESMFTMRADRAKFAREYSRLVTDGFRTVFVFDGLLAGGIENELPAKAVGKHIQPYSRRIDCPDFVDVTDGAAQLKLHTFAIRKITNNDIRPVEPALMEARVTNRRLRKFEPSGIGQGRLFYPSRRFFQ